MIFRQKFSPRAPRVFVEEQDKQMPSKSFFSPTRSLSVAALVAAFAVSPAALSSTHASAKGEPSEAARAAFDPADPRTWKTSIKLGAGRAEREALIGDLVAPSKNSWEKPLTRAEVEAILDDPRAERLYPDKTISIVAPSMLKRQKRGHVDLLKIFLKEERIAAGAAFMAEHAPLLAKVEKRHGVDREVIVSILMWESRLGTITGDYFAFNSFVSQAFFIDEANAVALSRKGEKGLISTEKQKARVERIRKRARGNLISLMRVCKARGIDPLGVKGSWAGALGFPQFMPASLRWAEDGDGDGKIDLFTFPDSIASIGRYLKDHGFGPTPESQRKAVWGYNHEDAYVEGVLAFAKALKERKSTPPKAAKAATPAATASDKKGKKDKAVPATTKAAGTTAPETASP